MPTRSPTGRAKQGQGSKASGVRKAALGDMPRSAIWRSIAGTHQPRLRDNARAHSRRPCGVLWRRYRVQCFDLTIKKRFRPASSAFGRATALRAGRAASRRRQVAARDARTTVRVTPQDQAVFRRRRVVTRRTASTGALSVSVRRRANAYARFRDRGQRQRDGRTANLHRNLTPLEVKTSTTARCGGSRQADANGTRSLSRLLFSAVDEDARKLTGELARLGGNLSSLGRGSGSLGDGGAAQPRPTYICPAGPTMLRRPKEPRQRDAFERFRLPSRTHPRNQLGLAEWLTDPRPHPSTASRGRNRLGPALRRGLRHRKISASGGRARIRSCSIG
jgi:hypothetical protein